MSKQNRITPMLAKAYRRLYRAWYRLVTLRSSPERIAAGFALGIFLAYMPIVGQTALAIGLASLLRINPLAAAVGVFLTNPFTAGPIFMWCHALGRMVLGESSAALRPPAGKTWLDFIWGSVGVLGVTALGGMMMGLVSAIPAYFIGKVATIKYLAARHERRLRRFERRMKKRSEG